MACKPHLPHAILVTNFKEVSKFINGQIQIKIPTHVKKFHHRTNRIGMTLRKSKPHKADHFCVEEQHGKGESQHILVWMEFDSSYTCFSNSSACFMATSTLHAFHMDSIWNCMPKFLK